MMFYLPRFAHAQMSRRIRLKHIKGHIKHAVKVKYLRDTMTHDSLKRRVKRPRQ